MPHKLIGVLEEIGKYFKLKENSIGPPKLYLGGMVSKREVHSNVTGKVQAWGFISSQYIQSAINNVVKYLKDVKKMNLPKSMDHPIKREYIPEDDSTVELKIEDATYYQSLIGLL